MSIDTQNHSEFQEKAENRIKDAKKIISEIAPTLDQNNVFGIMAFGSFWETENSKPRDIDLAVYCDNDLAFRDEETKLTIPLEKELGLRVEIHPLTPFTPMVRHAMNDYKVFLKHGFLLWGKMPEWLYK